MIHNQSINSKDINIKKFLKYSDNYTLIPIKYTNNDFLIQTPKPGFHKRSSGQQSKIFLT